MGGIDPVYRNVLSAQGMADRAGIVQTHQSFVQNAAWKENSPGLSKAEFCVAGEKEAPKSAGLFGSTSSIFTTTGVLAFDLVLEATFFGFGLVLRVDLAEPAGLARTAPGGEYRSGGARLRALVTAEGSPSAIGSSALMESFSDALDPVGWLESSTFSSVEAG